MLMHVAVRSGDSKTHLEQQKTLSPYVMVSPKSKYQALFLSWFENLYTAPQDVIDSLHATQGFLMHLRGDASYDSHGW